MKIHSSITLDRVMGAVASRDGYEMDNPGFCTACGERVEGCEPDACEYVCDSCGEPAVYGAEEILLMGGL